MKLSSFTDYTLRVLMYLAAHPDRLVNIHEIAQAYGISENHLMKVVHHLAKTGVVATLRGKGGGLRLAQPLTQIRLGKVIRAAEGDGPIVECFSSENQCRITQGCKLARILHRSFEQFYAALDEYALNDLIDSPQTFGLLLQLRGIQES